MQRKKYDKAFKVGAVLQVVEESQSVSAVAKSLGILPTMLSLTPIPLAESSVDKVFSIHSIYFWDDLNKAMSEVSRVLRPGGSVIFTLSDGTGTEDNLFVKDVLSTKVIPAMQQAGFTNTSFERGPTSIKSVFVCKFVPQWNSSYVN